MADPLGKILLRGARRLFIWPLEAGLVLALYGIARLLPLPVASAVMGMLFALVGPLTPWHGRARRNLWGRAADAGGRSRCSCLA